MLKTRLSVILLAILAAPVGFLILSGPAWAYVGPGAGISLLSSVLGLVLLWPLRALWRRRVKASPGQAPAAIQTDQPRLTNPDGQ